MDKDKLRNQLREQKIQVKIYPTLSRTGAIRTLINTYQPSLIFVRNHIEEMEIKSTINTYKNENVIATFNSIDKEIISKKYGVIIFTHPIENIDTFYDVVLRCIPYLKNITIYTIIKTFEILGDDLRFILQILKNFPGVYTIDKLVFDLKYHSESFRKIYPNIDIFQHWKEKEIKNALSLLIAHNIIIKWENVLYKSPLPKFERMKEKIYTTVYDFTKKLIRKPIR